MQKTKAAGATGKVRIPLKFRAKCWLEDQIKKRAKCRQHYSRYNGPIHGWFGLSYCSYFTVPRIALQGMPLWWQYCFLLLVNALPETPEYVCQRRDENGKFIKDPWANYRRGDVEELIRQHEAENKKEWKIVSVENVKHPKQ